MSNQLLIENIKDKIELRFMGYHVEGEAVLQHWGGETGFIQMKPFDIDADDISRSSPNVSLSRIDIFIAIPPYRQSRHL